MDIQFIHKQIKNKKLTDKVFTFYGEESGIRDIYVNKIVELSGGNKIVLDSADKVLAKLIYKSIFDKGGCIVLYNDVSLTKDLKKWKSIVRAAQSSKYYLIVIYDKIDKRSSFWKTEQDWMVEFTTLSPSVLGNHIKKKLPGFSDRYCEELAGICFNDYNRIMTECDKIKCYARGGDYNEAYLALMKAEVIYRPVGDITFVFVDKILLRDKAGAFEYSQKAKEVGESEILTLSVLYSGMRNILLMQELPPSSNASEETGLTPWQIRNAKMKKGHYTSLELVNALKLIRRVEKSIKTGEIDAAVAVDYVLVSIM